MGNINNRQAIILGALLHDIGKFVQRAQENPRAQKHTFWGEKWFTENLSEKLSPVFGAEFTNKISSIINSHHDWEEYVTPADAFSAGAERIPLENEEKGDPFTDRLKVIFSQVYGKEVEKYYKLSILKGLDEVFPIDNKKCTTKEYSVLLNNFNKEIGQMNFSGLTEKQTIEKIYYILLKYTWCIPSAAYEHEPDISLFEHLKTTSAIATCLYDLKEENKKSFILLSGDISGIQDFIYSVTTEHALKGLRGRSFFLQLLSETVARRILDEFDLTLCNILFLGGGNFTILLPGGNGSEEKIEKIKKEIHENIFKAFKGKLGLIVGYTVFSPEDFKLEKFGKVIERLSGILAREKRRKFKEILDYKLFTPYEVGGETQGCDICGKELKADEYGRCNLCKSFENFSSLLTKMTYMEIEKTQREEITSEINNWNDILKALGYNYWFKKENEKSNIKNSTYLFNDTNLSEGNYSGFRFEATYSPEGTLEDMTEKANGIKKWGALRMDVDNLGKIFSEGLKNKTISRFSMLSYMLSLFFSMGIREITEGEYRNCCVVYSGGDDLFILGPWSELPKVAEKIQKDFKKYVCNHSKITLSGGIFIAPSGKFPVYQAAREAGYAEHQAKIDEKNKITFLEKPLKWEDFYKIERISDDIVKVLNHGVARSLLTILYAGYQDKKLFEENKISMMRIWRLFYAIKRLMERHKDFASELEDLRKKFIIDDFELMPELDIAVRWADLLTRTRG